MPKIREQKVSAADISQYNQFGPCVKVGAEVWFFSGKNLSVGEITKIEPERGIHIKTATGIIFKNTTDTILMAEPDKRMKKYLATQARIKKKKAQK